MSLEACAALVRRADPDRFAPAMTAPEADRALLWPLYAFNLEVARAAWASPEPLIAQMRLQFWADTLDEAAGSTPPRAHEVAAPLTAMLRATALPVAPLAALVQARRWDTGREGFADAAALWAYLEATSGNLMQGAVRLLGGGPGADAAALALGRAQGLANWLVAVPALEAAGRRPLPDPAPGAISELARAGLSWLAQARADRGKLPRRALPALLAAWQAGPVLQRAAHSPGAVAAGALRSSEFRRRGTLLLRAVSGRW